MRMQNKNGKITATVYYFIYSSTPIQRDFSIFKRNGPISDSTPIEWSIVF